MKRRDFSLSLAATLLPLAGTQAQAAQPVAGEDYHKLERPAPVEAPAGKIEVVEFFWYNCPHCNSFEPEFNAWIRRAPQDVVIRRVPVAFRSNFVGQQHLYYALEAMGLVDKLHAKVFHTIHAERTALERPEVIGDWVAKHGVDKAQFMAQFNSFTAASKSTRATQLTNAYQVEGVPALGVAGRFYTDGSMAKGMGRALQVVDYLVGEVRKGR